MRTVDEIKRDYESTKQNDTLIQTGERCYEMKNAKSREALREEYIQTLPENKQLAIWLHSKLCHHNHTDGCGFFYEIHDLEDNWEGYAHKEYLEKADDVLAVTKDINMIKNIVEIIR